MVLKDDCGCTLGVLQERKGMLLFPLFPYSGQHEQPLYFCFYLCFGILESLPTVLSSVYRAFHGDVSLLPGIVRLVCIGGSSYEQVCFRIGVYICSAF